MRGFPVTVQAYILVQADVGTAASVARGIAAIPGVVSSEQITGPYDVIVRAGADDMGALGRDVLSRIQQVSGITRTLTCPIVDE